MIQAFQVLLFLVGDQTNDIVVKQIFPTAEVKEVEPRKNECGRPQEIQVFQENSRDTRRDQLGNQPDERTINDQKTEMDHRCDKCRFVQHRQKLSAVM